MRNHDYLNDEDGAVRFKPMGSRIRARNEKVRRGEQFCNFSGKRKHATKKAALTVANMSMKAGQSRTGGPLYVYKCRCEYWHLTHQPPRKPKGVV